MTTETLERPAAASTVDLDLDVRTSPPAHLRRARRDVGGRKLRGLVWRGGIAQIG